MTVFSMNIAGGDVFVQGVSRLAPPTSPSDERPPVMYGHFCLVLRVSVHDNERKRMEGESLYCDMANDAKTKIISTMNCRQFRTFKEHRSAAN